jgi:hypothetical protein
MVLLPQMPVGQQQQQQQQVLQQLQLPAGSSAGRMQQLQVGSGPGGKQGTVLLIPMPQLQPAAAAAVAAANAASAASSAVPVSGMMQMPQQQQ